MQLTFLLRSYRSRSTILALALRDVQSRYAGTLGGMVWAFIHPAAIIGIFYFVFAIGFKAQGPSNVPFILWFVCGMVPWFFFNDSLLAIADSISRNSHLVKKTIFPTETLPFVYILSGLFPHTIFLLMITGMLLLFDVSFSIGRFAVLYFTACTCILLLGLGWMLSALQVFYRDIGQALSIALNLWFWATPIVWPPTLLPADLRPLLFLNPVYYVVEGYRNLLIFDPPVWPSLSDTAYFWALSLVLLVGGGHIFRRLKPEFADVM